MGRTRLFNSPGTPERGRCANFGELLCRGLRAMTVARSV